MADNKSRVDRSITGNWKLTSYYISPGGPGEWFNADPLKPSYIEFTSDGKVNYTPESPYGAKFYEVISDSAIHMIRETDTLTFRYTLIGDELTLMPPCIEGCAMKYSPVKFQ